MDDAERARRETDEAIRLFLRLLWRIRLLNEATEMTKLARELVERGHVVEAKRKADQADVLIGQALRVLKLELDYRGGRR